MRRIGLSAAVLVVTLVLLATPAWAYIGPGAGITVLGALWGVIVALVLGLGAVLMWPIRGLFRRRRRSALAARSEATVEAAAPAPGPGRESPGHNPAE
jgi:hypothetical protein